MVLSDHVEVLRQGTVGDKACTSCTQITCHGPFEVRSQQARILTSCRSRVPGEDLKLVSLTPIALIRTKSRPTRTTRRRRFPICVKVRNGSGVPACRAGLLGAPSIHPVLVILAMASRGVVNTEPQRAVDWRKRAVGIRDGNRPKPWWQANWRGQNSTNYIQADCLHGTKKTLSQQSLNASKKQGRNKPKQLRQSQQLSITGLSNYCSSRNGRVKGVVRKHKIRTS